MNDQSASTRSTRPGAGKINGWASYSGLADNRADAGPTHLHRHDVRDPADHRLRPQWSTAQAPGDGCSSEFVTVFSHELRNSLSAIRLAARILRTDTCVRPELAKAKTVIERQVAQMTRLVDDLLEVSRERASPMLLQSERVDLCAIAAHCAQTVALKMQERDHCMTTSLPDAPIWLQADPGRLEQVFVNLLFNAAKYTERGGCIGLSVEEVSGEAVVRIRDNGIGIDSRVLPHVFDLFVQADPSSRRADGGVGIGLTVARRLVERHGGRVSATSAGLGHGSEFTVRLPTIHQIVPA